MSDNTARDDPERARLRAADLGTPWRLWGPYLSERQWGTVREDYSADGEAWNYLPHDHARSRAYRWGEDGLAGLCDERMRMCFALAFWNGVDPILKERVFGLTGNEGNHGEDAKEYWWYNDATPTASWLRWQYVYPQRPFPYADLVAENGRRGRAELEYELLDTGVFEDDRYWDIAVEYAKATERDIRIAIHVRNAGPDAARLHVLPTLWFRNTWSWDPSRPRPAIHDERGALVAEHPDLGAYRLTAETPGGEPLFCDNETNTQRLFGIPGPAYPKDGIGDHVVHGRQTVNPDGVGTKAALRFVVEAAPGETVVLHLRLAAADAEPGAASEAVLRTRRAEADAFYRPLTPADASADEAMVMRQAFAGMIWSEQVYLLDVERWLEGDPGQPPPPAGRDRGRNAEWRHLNVADVISMPDKWEYPWFAAWDLAFHAVALAHVDPAFAKRQLLLMTREWYMHPSGQLPAYEWSFGDVNPPVHPFAALRVFDIDGRRDRDFLERLYHKLLINFTWWVNRKDAEGNNLFEGGFLGLDNIGPFDRSQGVPPPAVLEQADGTAWMAVYCLGMLFMALVLAEEDPTYEDVAIKFLDHFTYIARAINRLGIWDEEDGFYYDQLTLPGSRMPVRVRSVVGLLPIVAVAPVPAWVVERVPDLVEHLRWFLTNRPDHADAITVLGTIEGGREGLLAIVSPERLPRLLNRMLDEAEFLSPYGIRALSRHHLDHPFAMQVGGETFRVDYEPAESTTPMFGGNSNWRGPIWFPVNYLLIGALRRYEAVLGPDFTIEYPTGSGKRYPLFEIAEDLANRLIAIFLEGERGRRPVFGGIERFQEDPAWHDRILFHEYFHGDNGAGIGASHQTGWTGLVADLIADRPARAALRARRESLRLRQATPVPSVRAPETR